MARNPAGTYSLPNPAVSAGAVIQPTWANSTLSDIGTELTASLDRNGRGAMLAPLKVPDGTVALPSLTFANDLDTGLFRNAANDLRVAAGGVEQQRWTAAGAKLSLDDGASGAGNLAVAFLADTDTGVYRAGANDLRVQSGGIENQSWTAAGTLLRLADGNTGAGNLAAAFASDSDTGLWRGGANDLRIQAGGVDALVITPGGVTVAVTLTVAAPAVTTVGSLLNSWTGSFRYYKDGFGRVFLDGTINGNAGTNTILATLPSGYRPAANRTIIVYGGAGGQIITIQSGGDLLLATGSATDYKLDNVHFATF